MSFMSSIATIVGFWYLPEKQTIWLEIGFVVALGKPLPTDLDVFFFYFFSKGCLWIIVDSKNYLAFCLVHFLCILGRNSGNSSDFRGIDCPNKAGWWWGSTPVWKKSKNSSESAGSGFLYFQETNCPEIRFCHEKIR